MKKLLLLALLLVTVGSVAQTKSEYQAMLERLEALETKIAEVELATQEVAAPKKSRLSLGGYGEVTMSRHFYSDAWQRYTLPSNYADASGYGRFDIPHAVFFVNYDFGRGWSFQSEIEFEHGGLEVAMEIEEEETGEYETEVENGGEVILEQFWINKEWSKALNLKMGHIIVPVGMTNKYHMPNEYFGVFRPEGESTILPSTWHETGVSFWGRSGDWAYEVMFVAGLDADRFSSADWIASGSGSPYEFKIANNYAGAFRIDNYSVKDLTLSLSGYYGHSASNSLKSMYGDDTKGAVMIGSFDFRYTPKNLIFRGNVDYGTLGDAAEISINNRQASLGSPSPGQGVGSSAISAGAEVGYDMFSFIPKMQDTQNKLYLFARAEYYDSMFTTSSVVTDKTYCENACYSVGLNYFPMKEIAIKLEYQSRQFPGSSTYNTENTLMIGFTYTGFYK